jgi:AcrR family transcriptional regulator/DNA-binding MarR family transcriptional regulator
VADRPKSRSAAQGGAPTRRGAHAGRGGAGGERQAASALRQGAEGTSAGGLAHGGVPDIQRARILAALVEVAREHGAGRVTVARVVARSGVSRRTFYELFEDRDACFLAAFEGAVARAQARVAPAFRAELSRRARADRWRERVRAGLLAILEFLDDEPGLGGLCVVDALGAGQAALARRAAVVEVLVDAIDEGRGEAKSGLAPNRLTAEGVVGGVLAVLYVRLAAPAHQPTVELLNPLMRMIVLPYLGPAAAARELGRPKPQARPPAASSPSNPLEGLEMRLTYRTVRVLVAIAAAPAASNRQIADAAEVQDQGQISKLLARLEHIGLIENRGVGSTRGEPNAWSLTQRGHEVEHAIHQQTTPSQH